jgi:hypothetical protein
VTNAKVRKIYLIKWKIPIQKTTTEYQSPKSKVFQLVIWVQLTQSNRSVNVQRYIQQPEKLNKGHIHTICYSLKTAMGVKNKQQHHSTNVNRYIKEEEPSHCNNNNRTYNMRILQANIKYLCTSFKNMQKIEHLMRFSSLLRVEC